MGEEKMQLFRGNRIRSAMKDLLEGVIEGDDDEKE